MQGRDIGGMIYVGTPPHDGLDRQQSRAFLDSSLRVQPPVQPPQLAAFRGAIEVASPGWLPARRLPHVD